MRNNEAYPTSSTETNPNNPWQEMADEVANEGQSAKTAETNQGRSTESEDYREIDGVKYRILDRINVSTDQGKYEWLYGFADNGRIRAESELDELIYTEGLYGASREELNDALEDNEAYQEIIESLETAERRERILESLEINGNEGTLDALKRRVDYYYDIQNKPEVSRDVKDVAFDNWIVARDLYTALAFATARRDPEYFGEDSMTETLRSEVSQAEQRLDETMIDEYIGEDGFIHKLSGGEKMPSPATDEAKTDLKYAEQDLGTFEQLMSDFRATQEYGLPIAVRREAFVPTIDGFINERTARIEQLLAESKTMTKGTPEYEENLTERRKLASERSSARRIRAKYFNIPAAETAPAKPASGTDTDDGARMEQIPTGKTKEQIDIEKSRAHREKVEAESEDELEDEYEMSM